MALAVSNADQDERFYADISEKLGYDTKSLIALRVKGWANLRVLELVNRQGLVLQRG